MVGAVHCAFPPALVHPVNVIDDGGINTRCPANALIDMVPDEGGCGPGSRLVSPSSDLKFADPPKTTLIEVAPVLKL